MDNSLCDYVGKQDGGVDMRYEPEPEGGEYTKSHNRRDFSFSLKDHKKEREMGEYTINRFS